jgi:hypothetical protein
MPTFRPVFAACLAIACGAASPAPAPRAADTEPGEPPAAAQGDASEAQAAAPKRGQCFEKCAAMIEDAAALLRQAKGLKGAEQAALALYGRAAEAHLKAWRGCDLALPSGEDRSCSGAAEVTRGMAESFEGAKRPDGVVYAYLVALDDRWREDGSAITTRAREDLAARAEAAAKSARDDPKGAHAADSLAAAVYAALALDEVTRAAELAAEHRKRFGASAPDSVSLVAAAVATYYVDHEQYGEALTALPASSDPARTKHPAPKILWHAIRGRALAGAGKPAGGELRAAASAWTDPDPKDPSKVLGRQEPAPMLGREAVVDAAGAAHFLLGEDAQARASRLAPPRYQGPENEDGVERFIQGPLAQWAQQRQRPTLEADAEYAKVLGIRPVPPPHWVVLSTARRGKLWGDFADAMLEIKLPPKLAEDEITQGPFEKAMRGSAKPAIDSARKSYEACRKLSTDLHVEDDVTKSCQAWLDGHRE